MPWARHGVRLKADAANMASTSLFRRLESLARFLAKPGALKRMLSGVSAVVLALAFVSPPSLSLARCPARRRCPFGRPDDSRHVRWPGVETDAHSECLPEEVVAAGGSAHVVTFARLGAINAPAVRDHFPRLLESGVPEAVLLHIYWHSTTRRTGPTAGADRRASPTHHAPGVADGGSRGHGPITEGSHLGGHGRQPAGGLDETGHGVQSRTVATLAEAGEFALVPLDANKLHIIAGALRIGNY